MNPDHITYEIESTLADGSEFTMARISGPEGFDVTRLLRDALTAQGRKVFIYTVEEKRAQVIGMGSPAELLARHKAAS